MIHTPIVTESNSQEFPFLTPGDVLAGSSVFLTLPEVRLSGWAQPEHPSNSLWELAQKCESLSGRTLRRLPYLALAMYTYADKCTIEDALKALTLAIDSERLQSSESMEMG